MLKNEQRIPLFFTCNALQNKQVKVAKYIATKSNHNELYDLLSKVQCYGIDKNVLCFIQENPEYPTIGVTRQTSYSKELVYQLMERQVNIRYLDDYFCYEFSDIDALAIPGGENIPEKCYKPLYQKQNDNKLFEQTTKELNFIDKGLSNRIPILGVCRGHQLLAVSKGGSIIDVTGHRYEQPNGETAYFDSNQSNLKNLLNSSKSIKTISMHKQAINLNSLKNTGLRVSMWSKDSVIKAIESSSPLQPFVVGTQFHPECMYGDKKNSAILDEFVRQAAEYKQRRGLGSFEVPTSYIEEGIKTISSKKFKEELKKARSGLKKPPNGLKFFVSNDNNTDISRSDGFEMK